MRRALLAITLCPFSAIAAQNTANANTDTLALPRRPVRCDGQAISDISVITQPPYTARLPGDLEIVRKATRTLHSTTRDNVVRRFLLFQVGEACDEVRRAESERILRAQPFLVDARITTYDDDRGGVRLEVVTRDEFSLILNATASLKSPILQGTRFGESNLAGQGIFAAAQWKQGRSYRDYVGVRIEDYQFAGEPNVMRFHATQLQQGRDYGIELLRPYFTDLQHFAWRGKIGGTQSFDPLLRPGLEASAIQVDREFQDIGAVARVGEVGRLKLVGVSLTRELVKIADHTIQVTPEGFRREDAPGPVPAQFHSQDVTRLNALVGFRHVRFAQVYGFDALNGVQDIRVGMQIGTLVGRSLQILGARDQDTFVLGDIYMGYGNPHSYLGMQTLTEARRDRTINAWEGVLTSGRIAWYLKPAVKQLTLAEILWATGSSVQVPYQLSFADPDGGMHGYRNSQEPGAHRIVVRVEQRSLITTRYKLGDLGAAVFAEAGKLWAAHDVAYAAASPTRASVGFSLLAAVPPKSRRVWRVDFGVPIGGDPDAKFEIRITNQDRTRTFWKDPVDVQRARERAVPASVFSWP